MDKMEWFGKRNITVTEYEDNWSHKSLDPVPLLWEEQCVWEGGSLAALMRADVMTEALFLMRL